MRRIYIDKYDYYKFLKELSMLPDGIMTKPLYYSEFKNIDFFVTVVRTNNPLKLNAIFMHKDLTRRNSFSSTVVHLTLPLDIEIMKFLFLDSQIQTVREMFDKLMLSDEIIKKQYSSLYNDMLELEKQNF